MNSTNYFNINHFESNQYNDNDFHLERRKRSFYDTFGSDDGLRKAKQLITEEKMANALKNLNLSGEATSAKLINVANNHDNRASIPYNGNKSQNLINDFDDFDEVDADYSCGILLSNELKETLKHSKAYDELELLKKISNSHKNVDNDLSKLQVVLWEPNKNIASKIMNELNQNTFNGSSRTESPTQANISDNISDNDSNSTDSDKTPPNYRKSGYISENESKDKLSVELNGAYRVEEPFESASQKRSLKRTYSQVNKIVIEEITNDASNDRYYGENVFVDKENNGELFEEASKYYIVDEEPGNYINNSNKQDHQQFIPKATNKITIQEIYDDSDSMEL